MSSTPTATVSGLGSGIDVSSIIDQLMTLEKVPQDKLKSQVTVHQDKVSQYQKLNAQFSSIYSAADALSLGSQWKLNKATSSDPSITATADSTSISGSLSFTVNKLATTQTLASFGSVASTSTSVTAQSSMLVGAAGNLGLGGLSGNLSVGAHALAVTTASNGASIKGAAAANSVTLTGSETLTASIDGTPTTFTLSAGTYNQNQLAQMVTQVSNGKLNVSVNSDKSLQVTTTHEGSAAALQITGGTGLAALGLSAGASTNGTNGVVTVDGISTTVTDIKPDGSNSVALNGGVTASFSGGLRVGTANVNSVSTGTGSLADVVSNINAANVGVSAAAVQVAPNQFRLQIQSKATGTAGAVSMDINAFAGTLGQLSTITAAQDAQLQVGGPGGYTITSSSNTVSGALPGVTMNLTAADPNKIINVTVAGDADGLATKVKAMIDAANSALTFIHDNSQYDQTSKSAGSLLGNSTAARLQQQLYSSISDMVTGSSLSGSGVGITSNADGTFAFDADKFKAAYALTPEAVASTFVEGGTSGVSTTTLPGIAERIRSAGKAATDSVSGWITTAISGENSTVTDLTKQIADWDLRLAGRRTFLQQQFGAMDSAVAKFKATSTWLTGQLSQLSANK